MTMMKLHLKKTTQLHLGYLVILVMTVMRIQMAPMFPVTQQLIHPILLQGVLTATLSQNKIRKNLHGIQMTKTALEFLVLLVPISALLFIHVLFSAHCICSCKLLFPCMICFSRLHHFPI